MLRQLLIVTLVFAMYKANAVPTVRRTARNLPFQSLERLSQTEYSTCRTEDNKEAFCIPYFACKVYENGDSDQSCSSSIDVCCQLSNIDGVAAASYDSYLKEEHPSDSIAI